MLTWGPLYIIPKIILWIILFFLYSVTSTMAQASPDGDIVPFSSSLPTCASKCGLLFDVQGKCVPPVTAGIDINCFCSDSRLQPFKLGTAEISSACGPTSCTSTEDLNSIHEWVSTFCRSAVINSNDEAVPSAGTSGSTNQSWIDGHARWVAMLVIIFILITSAWVAACIFRRRYLRKKEKQTEMAVPVAWGPHQLQGATGGYSQNLDIHEKSKPKSNVINNPDLNTSTSPLNDRAPN